jgi:predicted nucleotidyltransferase
MDRASLSQLQLLTDAERSCLSGYLDLLAKELGDNLDEVIVFGSIARGERWPSGMRIRSDLDLLVLTDNPLPESATQSLIDATYPLFLECGRPIAPQFRTREQIDNEDEQNASFKANLASDGVSVLRRIEHRGSFPTWPR